MNENLWDMGDRIRSPNNMRYKRKGPKEWERGVILQEILVNKFPELKKDTSLHTDYAHTSSKQAK